MRVVNLAIFPHNQSDYAVIPKHELEQAANLLLEQLGITGAVVQKMGRINGIDADLTAAEPVLQVEILKDSAGSPTQCFAVFGRNGERIFEGMHNNLGISDSPNLEITHVNLANKKRDERFWIGKLRLVILFCKPN